MRDSVYYIRTDTEHGRTKERLRRAAADRLGISPSDHALEVMREREGKPYFPHAPIHASVSHSGGVWLAVLSCAPVGADLQKYQRCDAVRIARRFFHPLEADYLSAHTEDFFKVWCAKESYVKYTGGGLAQGLDSFSAVAEGRLAREINGVPIRTLEYGGNWWLCICGGEPGEPEIIELKE